MNASRWTSPRVAKATVAPAALALALMLAACGSGKDRHASAATSDAGSGVAAAPAAFDVTADAGPNGRADAGPPRAAVTLTPGEVKLTDLGWDPRAPRPDDAELRKQLEAELAEQKLFVAVAPGAATVPARIELTIGLAFDGEPGKERRVDAAVAVRLRWKEDGVTHSMESRVMGQLPITTSDRKQLPARARDAFARALADATRELVRKDGIRRGDEAQVIAALDADDPDVRTEAFRAVSERRLAGAVPRLIELLRSPNPEIRDAAIGGLVELGDPRGVKPLVDMVEFSDLDMMRRIIDAVGMIGGDEARDYLEFVASGHETPAVRRLAKEALGRLKRREAAASPR